MKTKPFDIEEAIKYPNKVVGVVFCSVSSPYKITKEKLGITILWHNKTWDYFTTREAMANFRLLDDEPEDHTPVLKDFNDLPIAVLVRNLTDPFGGDTAFVPSARTAEHLSISFAGIAATISRDGHEGWQWTTDNKTWHRFKFA